jgi:heat shock protein HslJ
MDDATGTVRPKDPSLYTIHLKSDGTVKMRLNCNHAGGTWSIEPSGKGASGHFEFGPLAATRALCPPPSLDESIAAQAKFIRSYLLKDGKLYLSLMADGGIYAWEPYTGKSSAAGVPAAPEDGGPRNWEVSGVSRSLNLREQPSTKARIVSGVARSGGGYATVVIKKPDGHTRAIFFRMGIQLGSWWFRPRHRKQISGSTFSLCGRFWQFSQRGRCSEHFDRYPLIFKLITQ